MSERSAKVVGAIGVAWYMFGATQFAKNLSLDTAREVANRKMTQIHADAFLGIPTLIWVFYGAAVLCGVIGGIQLLRARSNAWLYFGAALVFDLFYFGWIRFVAYTFDNPPAEAGILAVVVLSVGAVLTLFSYRALGLGPNSR